jgi:hypothetical protein
VRGAKPPTKRKEFELKNRFLMKNRGVWGAEPPTFLKFYDNNVSAWNVCLFACVFVSLFACLFVCLRICARACVRACVRVCFRVCFLACLFVCLRVCLLVCLVNEMNLKEKKGGRGGRIPPQNEKD